jgi:hypothetical protein
VVAESADLGQAQAIAVEAHQLLEALGVPSDPQLHHAGWGSLTGTAAKAVSQKRGARAECTPQR